MRNPVLLSIALACLGAVALASGEATAQQVRIVLLHHSTGGVIWDGGLPEWFSHYNSVQGTQYEISEQIFPKDSPYGWDNYPYDYWNIWVDHAGNQPYLQEPTLELLTPQYDVIVWKHCYPVSNIQEDIGEPDIRSAEKRLENYLLQYEALKAKMRQFPQTLFVVWTGPALLQSETDAGQAQRAAAFVEWVKESWDEPGDNIFLWDFYELETEGGLYLKPEYSAGDSHPGHGFALSVAPYLGQRLISVIEGKGDASSLTGVPGTAVSVTTWAGVKTAAEP